MGLRGVGRGDGVDEDTPTREDPGSQPLSDALADLRQRIQPFAAERGYVTDDDVFRDVS